MTPPVAFTVTEIERTLEAVSPDPFIASLEATATMRHASSRGERLPDDADRERALYSADGVADPRGAGAHRRGPAV